MDRISNEGFLHKAMEHSDQDNQFPIEEVAADLTLTPEEVNRFADQLTDLRLIERPQGAMWQLIGEAADEGAGYRHDPASTAASVSKEITFRPLMESVSAILRLFTQGTLQIMVATYSPTQWAGEILNAAEKIKQDWKPDPDDLANAIASRVRRSRDGVEDRVSMSEAVEGLADLARDAFVAEMIARKIPADAAENARKTLSIGE